MNINSISHISTLSNLKRVEKNNKDKNENIDFMDVLKETVSKLNKTQQDADKASASIANGTVKDLHQAAITIDKAELNMKLMLEIRNKALNAYKDILRTQV